MSALTRRDKAVEGARARIDKIREHLTKERETANKPSQEELRRKFDEAAEWQGPEKLDIFKMQYGDDEFYRQWMLRTKRLAPKEGTDGNA